ncbi:hypothetical protein [Streptomyces collinus]|uniref:hypothetical protein n=1 Tax=Streptomyces collinus TaxID=42684 RepID=UPI0036753C63
MNRLRGTALTLAHLPSGYLAYAALVTQPQGAWDESTLTGIETACALLIVLSAATFLLALPPVRRRTLGRWWLAPALAFLLVGAARWTYIVQTYPQGPGG